MRSGSTAPGNSTVLSGNSATLSVGLRPKRLSRDKVLRALPTLVLLVAVAQHHLVLAREALGELCCDVHGTVPAACAADRHRERGALVEHEARQPALQEALHVLDQ